MMPAHTTVPSLSTAPRATGTSAPTGPPRIYGGVQGLGRRRLGISGTGRAPIAGEISPFDIAQASEGIDLAAFESGHLSDNVGGRGEALNAKTLGLPAIVRAR